MSDKFCDIKNNTNNSHFYMLVATHKRKVYLKWLKSKKNLLNLQDMQAHSFVPV